MVVLTSIILYKTHKRLKKMEKKVNNIEKILKKMENKEDK